MRDSRMLLSTRKGNDMHDIATRATASIKRHVATDGSHNHSGPIEIEIATAQADSPHLAMLQLGVIQSYADDLAELAGPDGECRADMIQRAIESVIEYVERSTGLSRNACGADFYVPANRTAVA